MSPAFANDPLNGPSDIVAAANGVCLRPMRESDIDERYLSWFRDSEVTKYLESRHITADDALEFLRWGHQTQKRFIYAICLADSGLHIGNVKIGDIRTKSMVSDLVTVIGDRQVWGKGYAATAIRLAIGLAFDTHGIRKLSAGIYSNNVGSLKAYTRAGFLVEAVLHAHDIGPDGMNDRIVIACFNPRMHPAVPAFPLPLPV
jgi:RimJ/RimL family protein N-acetyltransferase